MPAQIRYEDTDQQVYSNAVKRSFAGAWAVLLMFCALVAVVVTLICSPSGASIDARIESTYGVKVVGHTYSKDTNRVFVKDGEQTKECLAPSGSQMDSRTPMICHEVDTIPAKK